MSRKKQNGENLRSRIVEEMYKPIRVHFKTRRVEIRGYDDIIGLDLADMSKLKKYNKGYTFFLLAVNCFSRKCYTLQLKNKTTIEVGKATIKILEKSKTKFKFIWTDQVFLIKFSKKINLFFSSNFRVKNSTQTGLNKK